MGWGSTMSKALGVPLWAVPCAAALCDSLGSRGAGTQTCGLANEASHDEDTHAGSAQKARWACGGKARLRWARSWDRQRGRGREERKVYSINSSDRLCGVSSGKPCREHVSPGVPQQAEKVQESDDILSPCYVPGVIIPSTTARLGLGGLEEGVWGEDAPLRALDPLGHSAFSLWWRRPCFDTVSGL